MKRILSIISALGILLPLAAQEHLSERVYVSTDRDVYVAGDEMFLSAFCLDMTAGGLSASSATAYLEIISPEGPVQTAKVALKDGRGGGVVHLLNTIPTGNYKLIAYTSQCFNEEGYDFEEGARTLSIINPFTSERSSAGVSVVSPETYASAAGPAASAAGSISVKADGLLTLTNSSDKPVTVSVSLFNDDGIASPGSENIVSFCAGATAGRSFTHRRAIDYEGEIIRAKVRGVRADSLSTLKGTLAFLSIPGRMSDVYTSRVNDKGEAAFYTRNIFGNEETILEVDSATDECHLDLVSPFAGVSATHLDSLRLSESLKDRILRRSLAMQIASASQADTLYEYLKLPEDLIFTGDAVTYWLDDYTRFPVMEELFIEFIRELKAKKTDSGRSLVVFLEDSFRPAPFSQLPALVLLDGVPVLDHNKIFDYDPLLVERIVVSPHTYNFGDWYYAGVVNFITYKHNLPSYEFEQSARVVDYQGVSYPVVCYMPSQAEGMPDLRQTVLWHPLVEIGPGESRELNYSLPSYDGDFTLVVEGLDSDGAPQYLRTKID